jgi:hypothetical protein
MLGLLLVGLVVFGRTCAGGVSDFIMSFSPPPSEGGPGGSGELRRLTDVEIRERYPSLIARDAGAEAESVPEPAPHPDPPPASGGRE